MAANAEVADEFRVLLKTATAKDAALARTVLQNAGCDALECANMAALADELQHGAGALFIAEEFLADPAFRSVVTLLATQPSWSDLPVLILARTGADSIVISSALEMPANFAVIERPVRISSFVSAVKVALRARARQYELRKVMEGLRIADQRKTEFLATLAHELRNPLAPLTNALALLQMTKAPPQSAAKYYAMMERQVLHMSRLIDDLMEVSRITRGNIDFKWTEVALDDVVRDAVDLSQPLMDAGGHEMRVRIAERGLRVSGDRVRLTQVLSNVLNNAAKYTPRAGRIQLTLARVGADAEIRVLDNGAGIPAAMLGSIFDMFVQVSGVARSAQGGLGIGLTLVKSLIERHGGQVKAFSEGIGKGAEIVVKLPLLDGAASALRTSAPAAPADISATVLIVDDNREAADSLCDLLSTMGARAVVAYSGEDSLKIVAESRPDVAILDIGMPEMDGWEVASRIRADERNAAMTLIALTGWGQSSDRDRSIQAGFDHHLMKPVRIDELLAILAPAPRAG